MITSTWQCKLSYLYSLVYINFYLALANNLIGNHDEVKIQYERMKNSLQEEYWQKRFDSLHLTEIANDFPKNDKQSREIIKHLVSEYDNYL